MFPHNIDHMRIPGIEPSSIIQIQTKYYIVTPAKFWIKISRV